MPEVLRGDSGRRRLLARICVHELRGWPCIPTPLSHMRRCLLSVRLIMALCVAGLFFAPEHLWSSAGLPVEESTSRFENRS